MKRYGKFAIAAGVMLAVLLGINFIPGQNGGVVWAEALSHIQQVQNVMYRMTSTCSGDFFKDMPKEARTVTTEATIITSSEHGGKMEMFMNGELSSQMYMLPSEKAMISVIPGAKKYIRMELDEDAVAKMQKDTNDPRYLASELMKSDYVELGRDVIDGIEVEGIAVTDPALFGGMYEKMHLELWVDAATGLPAQMKMYASLTMSGKVMDMEMIMYDYQFGIEIDPAEFVPEIGEDYTPFPTMTMPKKDGSSAIDGLKKFVEITGKYPQNLNIMNLMSEIQEFQKEQMMKEARARKKARQGMTEEQKKADKEAAMAEFTARQIEMLEENMPIMSAGQFYMMLVQEKRDPKYYGENVTPADSDAILLRWRLDDGKYRVIFGDLDQKDVSAEQLAEWENTTE
jgi:outer membrane lipoprotein-sorting protein